MKKIGIIGYGHMGKAIAVALKKASYKVITSDDSANNKKIPRTCDVVIICVWPTVVAQALDDIAPTITKNHIVISIAAGTPISLIQKHLPRDAKIVRVMPNLPAQVGHGVSGWISINLTAPEKNLVRAILKTFGEEIEVQKEDHINMITAISGSGPAYIFAVLETLEQKAREVGLPAEEARTLALATVRGAALYAGSQAEDFKTLKEMVKTKGGTTEAAFKILEKKKWQNIFGAAIENAYQRAREIGKKH
ncbi:MAG: Pyrroline-5-carboxylate reductase [Candidatus Peregrinibacteria bacterium GW2011_GWA2_47_7]|nr:MAG: Pyrroline-5-carboxylate reductase [Candidatus Peregrinibacteria bacterium GW2011_GWA2_47_7]